MSVIDEVKVRVARGARLLDEREPGWASRVAIDRLAMSHCDLCIIGQVFGEGYRGGLRYLFASDEIEEDEDVECGFKWDAFGGDSPIPEYDALARAWRDEVVKRTGGAS